MLPLGLSMLWESVEATTALRERFGFVDFDTMGDWVSDTLDKTWGVAAGQCSRMVISDHNALVWMETDQGRVVVKWSRAQERFAALDASTRLLRLLADRKIPVAAPIATSNGLCRVEVPGPTCALSIAVLPEVTGSWLDVTDRAAVFSAGACLAGVHEALRDILDSPTAMPKPKNKLNDRIDRWLAVADSGRAPEASRRLAELLSAACPLDDEVQLVHNDFRAANLLMQNSQVVGVLDFDDVIVDHRVKDLAKASVYLGTLFTDWRPTPEAARNIFRTGYESVRPLSPAEDSWFEILVLWLGIAAIPENDSAGWASAV
ncbi:phosphotransferase [Rhodococcus sp. G-MC3]|uniref:phosphotransferase n=1 Tax=Rhodococcus sp. G-MC3 TaxID=3046209 RepID=UPI0024BBC20C|nr:phosphotransferase [Rhodococcus sp. G-MC3]MDJ0394079.1 phosphotransferase [Rhodococcus sp. G-MC3]